MPRATRTGVVVDDGPGRVPMLNPRKKLRTPPGSRHWYTRSAHHPGGVRSFLRGLSMGTLPGPSSTTTLVRVALGIDPGTAIVGYAVVAARGGGVRLIGCDVITTPASVPRPERLQHIYHHLGELVSTCHPVG